MPSWGSALPGMGTAAVSLLYMDSPLPGLEVLAFHGGVPSGEPECLWVTGHPAATGVVVITGVGFLGSGRGGSRWERRAPARLRKDAELGLGAPRGWHGCGDPPHLDSPLPCIGKAYISWMSADREPGCVLATGHPASTGVVVITGVGFLGSGRGGSRWERRAPARLGNGCRAGARRSQGWAQLRFLSCIWIHLCLDWKYLHFMEECHPESLNACGSPAIRSLRALWSPPGWAFRGSPGEVGHAGNAEPQLGLGRMPSWGSALPGVGRTNETAVC
ncbi:hypothetical protein SAMN05421721_102271 [Ectothiorhodospira mobilis]|uniref:Uncharacterized protein n=1 Tax=Ectothiorhodospira mobilis TaxID=195064 RepID=A0A1I4PUW7_ECTMO|nr:hypothetical protein SAMN05421721_102271 [Ectothiorhodospira mobilis]